VECEHPASEKGSVTWWIQGVVENGDASAARELWERFFESMVRYARKRLGSAPRQVADEEDAALSAFHSFYEGAKNGRFPELHNRSSLWPLLMKITARKAGKQIRREHRQK
jgi:DNA-directed RNA polymerase specialized sigma24 family protein